MIAAPRLSLSFGVFQAVSTEYHPVWISGKAARKERIFNNYLGATKDPLGLFGEYNYRMLPPADSNDTPSRSEIYGLATIAGHASTRRDLRLKAIRALARIPDQNAMRVLGEMALWEEDAELRAEAIQSLEATFGDDLPAVLEGIRQELTGNWVESSTDEAEVEEQPRDEFDVNPQAGKPQLFQAHHEEGTPLWLLWAIIGVAVLGSLVYFFWLR